MRTEEFSAIAPAGNKKIKNNSGRRPDATARKGRPGSVKIPKKSPFPTDSGKPADLIKKDRGKNFRLFFEILVRLRRNFLVASIASCNV
ncbi:hypothetical protein [Burkholderia sp. MSMB1826]|uniref:hypothetical protein n=1 Tax=Burkholderia sp. MSMB1826 TaxID=1637875 RepID=UPI0012E37634|nr:hypothetical protein [Burkholderia sp. MSMB1826]